jgi:hypothetical protein
MARTSITRNNRLVKPIKDDLTKFFRDHGVGTRIIYRTCQAKFGDESPHNLIPADAEDDRVTIFLDFVDSDISTTNLNRVFAIPENHAGRLPKLKNSRFPVEKAKIDLNRLPGKYVFRELDDLKQNYRRIFS